MNKQRDLRQELETLEACAHRYQTRIDETIAKYGHGVRPSWVSADLSADAHIRDRKMAEAQELRSKISDITSQKIR